MAYQLGYAGGYADADTPPSPPVDAPAGGHVLHYPIYRPEPPRRPRPEPQPFVEREGRAIFRFHLSFLTWGEAEAASRRTVAVVAIGEGEGSCTVRAAVGAELRGHGLGMATTTAHFLTHVSDPRADERLVSLVASYFLDAGREP